MAGLVWGFLSSWNLRLASCPSISWQRDMSMAGPLSRSKPPEAGAEGQPLQGSSHRRPSAAEIAGTSSRRSIRLARRRNRGLALLTSPAFPRRFGWMWANTRRTSSRGAAPARAAPWPGAVLAAGEDGFPAVPDPIRGVPLSAQTKGLQARIRGSRKRSLPRGQMREARWRGTEGTGPILTAASCSHSPARRPAHLGRLSGSAWFSLAHPIRRTLDDARPSRPSPSLRCRSRGGQARAFRNDAVLDVAPQRHQQLARERHRHDLADPPLGVADPLDVPAAQRAVRLKLQPAPGQLHHQAADPLVAVLADALLALHAPALERRAGQADEGGDRAPVAERTAENLANQLRRGLEAHPADGDQQPDHPLSSLRRGRLRRGLDFGFGFARRVDLGELLAEQAMPN